MRTMRTGTLFFFIIQLTLLSRSAVAFGGDLYVDWGPGISFSYNTEITTVRYRMNTSTVLHEQSFYELLYSSWSGPTKAEAYGLGRGIRVPTTGVGEVSLTTGVTRISRTTSNLGQPYELYGRLGYDAQLGKAFFSLGWMHYSDGKAVFRWSGPNNGENFITLSLGMAL
jgi:hypothetical protein